MWLLFGICIIVGATYCADTNGIKNEHYLATHWAKYEGNKSPDTLKSSTKILSFSTPYNLNTQQWNEILRMRNYVNGIELTTRGNKVSKNSEPTYQTMQLRSSGSPLAEWLFTSNIDNEKIMKLIEHHRNHAIIPEERRNPSFSPWGGKRNTSPYNADPKIRRPSRVPFNSWGGKRDRENDRVDEENNENIKRHSTVNLPGIKKPFNSWGGKRAPAVFKYFIHLPSNDVLENNWQPTNSPLTMTSINRHFKQDFFLDDNNNNNNGNNDVGEEKLRITFEPWGGKKIDVDSIEDNVNSSASTLHFTQ